MLHRTCDWCNATMSVADDDDAKIEPYNTVISLPTCQLTVDLCSVCASIVERFVMTNIKDNERNGKKQAANHG